MTDANLIAQGKAVAERIAQQNGHRTPPPNDDPWGTFSEAASEPARKPGASAQTEAEYSRPRNAKVTRANTMTVERVTWAWAEGAHEDSEVSKIRNLETSESSEESSGRIPAGTVSIAAGPEGVGKSSFAIWLAARVSTGTLQGAWYRTPRKVIVCAVEDSWQHTLVPRLIAAGADTSMVARFDVVSESDDILTVSLPADNELLKRTITEHDVGLVILDPVLSLIHETLDSHRERDVRQALDPLARLADQTRCVILGIAHWTKGGGDVTTRITGSGAFKNVPRSVFAFARDPDSEDEFVMTQTKNNLGRYGLPSIRYTIESAPVIIGPNAEPFCYTGRFIPLGVSDKSVPDIIAARDRVDDRGDDDLTPAQRFGPQVLGSHCPIRRCGVGGSVSKWMPENVYCISRNPDGRAGSASEVSGC